MHTIAAENLFRRQALESLGRKLPGRPIAGTPRPWLWLTAVVLVLLAAAIALVANAEYARKERVHGWLVSESGIVRILNPATSSVSRLLIEPGQRVQKGQPLLHLSADADLQDGSTRVEAVLSQLRGEAAEIEAQLTLLEHTSELEQASMRRQLDDIDEELDALAATVKAQQQRIALAQAKSQQLDDALQKGAVARWDVLQQQDDAVRMQQELNQQRQRLIAVERERVAVRGRLDALPLQARLQESRLRTRLWQLAQDTTRHESSRLTVIRAPSAGTIANLTVRPGSSIAAGQLLLTIVPDDMQLAAEVFVPSRAAAYLREGQQVRISYDAFPKQHFGTFPAQVALVARDVSLPADIPRALAMNEAAYRVHINIDRATVNTSSGNAALRPGMRFAADIVLQPQSLADWLLGSLRMHATVAG